MIGKIIGIISFVLEKYDKVVGFVKTKYRQHRARKIRKAIDKRNTAAIRRIMQDIKDRRRERRDAS